MMHSCLLLRLSRTQSRMTSGFRVLRSIGRDDASEKLTSGLDAFRPSVGAVVLPMM